MFLLSRSSTPLSAPDVVVDVGAACVADVDIRVAAAVVAVSRDNVVCRSVDYVDVSLRVCVRVRYGGAPSLSHSASSSCQSLS